MPGRFTHWGDAPRQPPRHDQARKEAALTPVKIVVVDDHPLIRDAVRAMLAGAPEFEIVGEAESAERALALVAETSADLVLLDLGLPGMGGLVCLDHLRAAHPDVMVVVLSGEDDPQTVEIALRRGARAFVRKAVNPDDLAAALRQVTEASVFHAVGPAGDHSQAGRDAGLSPKELGVLAQLARGLSNKQIARALWISEDTVKFHLRHIYRKLGVANRTEALRAAHQRALVVPAPDDPEAGGS